ncbi:MAG: hypothetical protein ACK4WH_07955 [Phycisphaerales bacterium]
MPPTTDPIAAPPATGRRSLRHTRSVSVTVSVAIHTALVALTGLIFWRVADPPLAGPQTLITFESPTLGEDRPASIPAIEPAPRPPPEVRLDELLATPESARPAPPPLSGLTSALTDPSPGQAPSPLDGLARADALPTDSAAREQFPGEAPPPSRPVTFAGLGASNARSVVYAVDCSGSMVTSLPFVVAEVERSVAGLSPTQKFGVVLFHEPLASGTSSGVEVFAPVLVRATPSARARLREWLARARPSGRSAPMLGLERAVAYQPEAVFLLSRSIERGGGNAWDRSLPDALARVEAINPAAGSGGRRPILIQTIQFLDDDPTGIMQEIGRVHGTTLNAEGRPIAGYRLIRRGEDLGSDR